MQEILMSKSLAAWLIKNTKLTNEQIANFVGLNEITIVSYRIHKNNTIIYDPILIGMLSLKEIQRCEADSEAELKMNSSFKLGKKKADKVELGSAILWLINEYPNITDNQIKNLLKCTINFIESIRNESYKEYDKLIYQNPISLGLCSEKELNKILKNV